MKFYTNVKQSGKDILYIGYENGVRVKERIQFSPTLYTAVESENPEFKSYTGIPVRQIQFDNIKDAKDHIKLYDGSGIQMYGTDRFACEYVARNFPERDIKYLMALIRVFFIDIEVYSGNGFPDPYEANEIITAVTIYDTKTGKFHVWTIKPYDKDKTYPGDPIAHLRENIILHQFTDEGHMLYDLLQFWGKNHPDIVTGWNSRYFDMVYIINRIRKLYGEKVCDTLSPWGIIQDRHSNVTRFGVTHKELSYDMAGIAELDLLDLYKKYSGNKEESYKLGYIGEKNLGISKIEFDGPLHELYEKDYQKYVDYNIQDVNLVVQIEKKKKLLDLIVEVSYAGKVPSYNDSLGTTKYWEIFIYNHLLRKNQVTDIKDISVEKADKFAGAYVKDPLVGLHKWVISFDFASLYPSLIRQVNIGPETLVDQSQITAELKHLLAEVSVDKLVTKQLDLSILKKYNFSLSGNGQLYYRDRQSFLAEMVGDIFNRRKLYKKQMLEAERKYEQTHDDADKTLAEMFGIKQQALKILINAVYGACGSEYFQYYSIANAEAVTLTGQIMVQTIRDKLNNYLNTVLKTNNIDRIIAMDTDSAYVDLSDIVEAVFKDKEMDTDTIINFIDKFANERLTPMINKECKDMCEYLNNYDNFMDMKRESIAEKAIWTGKKRYFMSVRDSEGVRYAKPEISVTGLQSVSSSTPKICREAIEECLEIILTKDEETIQKFISKFKDEFYNSPVEKVAKPTGVGDVVGYTDPKGNPMDGTPANIRSAINYNTLLTKHNMTKTHEAVKNDSQIKWVYLKMPNPLHNNVIGFPDKLPKNFGLDKYIDYDTQFDKTFLSPIKAITDLIGWNTKEVNSLESLF